MLRINYVQEWKLEIFDTEEKKIFDHFYPASNLFQSFFIGVGKELLRQKKTCKKPTELFYTIYKDPSLVEEYKKPSILPNYQFRIKTQFLPIEIYPKSKDVYYHLLVAEIDQSIHWFHYECYHSSDGIDSAINLKIQQVFKNHNINWKEFCRLYYDLSCTSKNESLYVTPKEEHLASFSIVPGWNKKEKI